MVVVRFEAFFSIKADLAFGGPCGVMCSLTLWPAVEARREVGVARKPLDLALALGCGCGSVRAAPRGVHSVCI